MPTNGFNTWTTPTPPTGPGGYHYGTFRNFSHGADNNFQTVTLVSTTGGDQANPFTVFNDWDGYIFDFAGGIPSSPSGTDLSISPGTETVAHGTLQLDFYCVDDQGRVWAANHETTPAILLQSYDPVSGTQLSSDSIYGSGYQVRDISAFVYAGQTHIAVWLAIVDPITDEEPTAVLQLYNVDSGSPSDVGSFTFGLDVDTWPAPPIFFDGSSNLFYFLLHTTGSSGGFPVISGGTIFRIDLSSAAQTSLTMAGAYTFLGNPNNGHLYVVATDGSITEMDHNFFTVNVFAGLAGGGVGYFDIDGVNDYGLFRTGSAQFFVPLSTRAMKNPFYGCSVDPATEQFFVPGYSMDGSNRKWNRIQLFSVVDTLWFGTDWGEPRLNYTGITNATWIPFRQSIFLSIGAGTVDEFIYTTLPEPNPCAGVTAEFR